LCLSRKVEKMVYEYSAIVKGKENVPSEEGHKVGSRKSVSSWNKL
jgi:hypothetical protein